MTEKPEDYVMLIELKSGYHQMNTTPAHLHMMSLSQPTEQAVRHLRGKTPLLAKDCGMAAV